ncbi:unnamed protein product [Adineta ricciae]|uniref:Uncharacterized protein n=1 Tax=Adineta ricciae TaxID=249248 RepID=A0A815R5J1_ADIRI|nr:unnamed protein product [Adineta ricciae]CAF1472075.1 unnamed protein product [Adineta ricciae]
MERSTHHRSNICRKLYDYIKNINLFDEDEDLNLIDQLLATKVYLILLVSSLIIIVTFTAFTVQTQSVTIHSPAESIFRQLSLQYPSTFSCPCSQTSIRQEYFVSFDLQYHPICSSQFINESFLTTLSYKNRKDFAMSDYRLSMPSHFQILALFCRTIKETISYSIDEFAAEHFISSEVMSSEIFDYQIEQLVNQMKTTTTNNIRHISGFLALNIFQSRIYSALRTNYFIRLRPEIVYSITNTRQYSNGSNVCRCDVHIDCGRPARFYNYSGYTVTLKAQKSVLFSIPGLMVGCLPYNSLLSSTLKCFYNSSCINQIEKYIPSFSLVSPLSSSLSRFNPNTKVSVLLDQLFVESWNEKSNFSAYFEACSPSSSV